MSIINQNQLDALGLIVQAIELLLPEEKIPEIAVELGQHIYHIAEHAINSADPVRTAERAAIALASEKASDELIQRVHNAKQKGVSK